MNNEVTQNLYSAVLGVHAAVAPIRNIRGASDLKDRVNAAVGDLMKAAGEVTLRIHSADIPDSRVHALEVFERVLIAARETGVSNHDIIEVVNRVAEETARPEPVRAAGE